MSSTTSIVPQQGGAYNATNTKADADCTVATRRRRQPSDEGANIGS